MRLKKLLMVLGLHLVLLVDLIFANCDPGTTFNGTHCVDSDECKNVPSICGENTVCTNTIGKYFCQCTTGYKYSRSGIVNFTADMDGKCKDICKVHSSICGVGGRCRRDSSPKGYQCSCHPGFTHSSSNQSACIDICKVHSSICGVGGHCHRDSSPKGYQCSCHPGFTHSSSNQSACIDLRCERIMSGSSISETPPILKDIQVLLQKPCREFNQSEDVGRKEELHGDKWLEKLLSIVDELLAGGALDTRQKLSAMLLSVENALKIIGPLMANDQTRKSNAFTELEMLVKRGEVTPVGHVSLSSQHAQLDSNWETATGEFYPGFSTIALLSYKNLEKSANHSFRVNSSHGLRFAINSKVITAVVSNPDTGHLKMPVSLTFSHLEKASATKPTCVYWDPDLKSGGWSDAGCHVKAFNASYTVCSCSHLSSFAVLMALYDFEDTFELQMITLVGLSLSLICLLICIITFSYCRSIQGTRNTIHLHVCISLFIANLTFLAGISRVENKVGCSVVAGLLHFFYLAAFCWMCLEGVQLFRMVILVFNTTLRPIYLWAAGYGIPVVIVVLSVIINPNGYGTRRHCWLDLQSGFIWSFYGPVCVVILANVFFFLITVYKLAEKFSSLNPDLNSLNKIKTFTVTAVAQLAVLGTMWIFGCFQFNKETIVVSYIYTFLNCLQGVLIFIMHCLLSKQVRDEYSRILSCIFTPHKTKYSEFSTNQSSKSQASRSAQHTDQSHI
ncbi:CD97 antigen [Denticeps clupeoides]|uniref:CD97 antigen-like n=1 Tax=Denticeps clupeoides TaxID=299321 RepID=A0AAY4DH25_9TELE|nr:CD97 antigen-like [Denticeps clupeoides]